MPRRHYSAKTLTLDHGDPIATWPNLGSAGAGEDMVQATSGLRPVLHTDVLNGHPGVFSDGTKHLRVADATVELANPTAHYFVVQWTGALPVSTEVWIHDGWSSSSLRHTIGIRGANGWSARGGTGSRLEHGAADNDPHILAVSYNGASSWLRMDGITVATGSLNPNALQSAIIGQQRTGSGNAWVGYWHEIRTYQAAHSVIDAADIEQELADAWFGSSGPVLDVGWPADRHPLPVMFVRTAVGIDRGQGTITYEWYHVESDTVVSTGATVEWEPTGVGEHHFICTASDEGGDTVREVKVTVLDRPARFMGGTMVETPANLGPFLDAAGRLHWPAHEVSETANLFDARSSDNFGESWYATDAANRPTQNDLEGVGVVHVGDTFRILHQPGTAAYWHEIGDGTHPTHPGWWIVKQELVVTGTSPGFQACDLAHFPGGGDALFVSNATSVQAAIRGEGGGYSSWQNFGDAARGPMAAVADGVAYCVYFDPSTNEVRYRTLTSGGSLSSATVLATNGHAAEPGAVLPLVAYGDTVHVFYQGTNSRLWEVKIVGGVPGSPAQVTDRNVAYSPADSNQPVASAAYDAATETVHLLYGAATGNDVWHQRNGGAGWTASAAVLTAAAQPHWLRGNIFTTPAGRVFGFVYDAGSGGSGGGDTGPVHFASVLVEDAPPEGLTVTPVGSLLRAEWESSAPEFVLQRERWSGPGDPD